MKKRLLILAAFLIATLPSGALAQDIPEDLEDQPVICTEGVDCPGDPRYVPPPDPDIPEDLEDQPEASPPEEALPKDTSKDLDEVPVIPSPAKDGSPHPLTKAPETVPSEAPSETGMDQKVEDPLARDAEWYAREMGVSLEEAVRRLELQGSAGELGAQLEANEKDTFAGFWIQHEPEYRFVALFTRDGEEKIRPYIEGEPWAGLVEVRNGADATLEELKSEQAEAGRILGGLGIPTNSSINVQKNRVEVYVTDRDQLETALREAGLRLPDHVKAIEVARLAEPAATPGGEEPSRPPSSGTAAGGSPSGSGSNEPDRGDTADGGGSIIGNAAGIGSLLPATGGLPLAVLGAGVVLVGGGVLVRRIAR